MYGEIKKIYFVTTLFFYGESQILVYVRKVS